MPSTTTAPGRWPAAISSLTMLLIACAAPLDDGLAGGAAAGVVADVQEITAWQRRPTISRQSAAARLGRLGLDVIGRVDVAWVPHHPADRAGVARGFDLFADLVGPENHAAEGIVGEGLQPGPIARRLVGRAL